MGRQTHHSLLSLLLCRLIVLPFLFFAVPASANPAWLLKIDGAIGPATADYVERGLEEAQQAGAPLIVLQMNTPGGLDTAMRNIVRAITASPVPVAGYVGPAGARAASAGTYILYACHIAAMAPGTNLGAATPVQIGGFGGDDLFPKGENKDHDKTAEQDQAGDKKEDRSDKPLPADTMKRKMVNDAEAYLRSLAQLHGRNADWAAKAVRDSASLPAQEALELGVIDLIADNAEKLLQRIHGREVKLAGKLFRLDTQDLSLKPVEPDWRNKLLSVVTDPGVAYILMLLGIYGLFFEFSNPGSLVPGVLGGISLLLALFAFQVLPINYAGLALIFLGLALMAAEAFLPSFGVLGIGGIIAFVFGSIMLMDDKVPDYGIPLTLIIGIGVVSAVFFIWVVRMFINIRRQPLVSGTATILNKAGECLENEDGYLQVLVNGERWQANSAESIAPGDKIQVTGITGLRLEVKRLKGEKQ